MKSILNQVSERGGPVITILEGANLTVNGVINLNNGTMILEENASITVQGDNLTNTTGVTLFITEQGIFCDYLETSCRETFEFFRYNSDFDDDDASGAMSLLIAGESLELIEAY